MMKIQMNGIKNAEVVVGDIIQYIVLIVGVVCNIYLNFIYMSFFITVDWKDIFIFFLAIIYILLAIIYEFLYEDHIASRVIYIIFAIILLSIIIYIIF